MTPSADGEPVLRAVTEGDLTAFYAHQADPEASRMAVFPSRDEATLKARWQRNLATPGVTARTILCDGAVAGHVVCFELDGLQLVGYWIGREFWGRGLATRALTELLQEVTTRPLHARVARSNAASIRVLEKCGFTLVRHETVYDEEMGTDIDDALMRLT